MERLTKRDNDGQAMMDCEKCKADWTGKHGKPMDDCTALYCRNRLKDRLAAYEDTHMMPSDATSMRMDMAIIAALFNGVDVDRMKELAEADKNGCVMIVPCKIGDTVWVISNPWTGELLKKPIEAYVNGVEKFSHGVYVNVLFDTRKINGTRNYAISLIGKTVFLTREEAGKALEAMKNE